MSFLVILVSSAVELVVGSIENLRDVRWISAWHDWADDLLDRFEWWEGPVALLITAAVPMLVVGLFYAWLLNIGWLLAFIFVVILTLYCLGPSDLNRDIDSYLQAATDTDRAAAADMLTSSLDAVEDGSEQDLVLKGTLVEAHDRIYGALFWLALLGPVGIVLFRLATVLRRSADEAGQAFSSSAQRLYEIMIWIPARLFAFGFGVAGSLTQAFDTWRDEDDYSFTSSQRVIGAVGLAASQFGAVTADSEEEATLHQLRVVRGLINRTFVVWLTLLALATVMS